MQPTGVVLDPFPLWIRAIEMLLARLDLRVAATTTRADEVLALIRLHRPSFLILDDRLGAGSDAVELIANARGLDPELKVVVLSSAADANDVDAAYKAGASEVVFKTARPEDVLVAIGRTLTSPLSRSRRPRRVARTRRAPHPG